MSKNIDIIIRYNKTGELYDYLEIDYLDLNTNKLSLFSGVGSGLSKLEVDSHINSTLVELKEERFGDQLNKIKFVLNDSSYGVSRLNEDEYFKHDKLIREVDFNEYFDSLPKIFVIRKQYYFTRPFIIKLNVTEDIVELSYVRRFEINDKLEEFELFNCYLNRFELMKRNDWKDNSKFSVHLKEWDIEAILMRNRILEDAIVNQHFTDRDSIEKYLNIHAGRKGTVNRNGYLVNISALLQNGRIPSTEDHAFFPGHRVFNFFLKFKDSKFTNQHRKVSCR